MISFLCFLLAGIANGFMDRVSDVALYSVSIFPKENTESWFKSRDWYSKDDSWRRKYKNRNPKDGAAFFGSTTFLAWTTDFWHLCQSSMFACFGLGAVLFKVPTITGTLWDYPISYAIMISLIGIGFHISYDWITVKKK